MTPEGPQRCGLAQPVFDGRYRVAGVDGALQRAKAKRVFGWAVR